MNPYSEFKKIIAARSLVMSGQVVSVAVGTLQVRTVRGVITANVSDSTNYRVGDTVLVDSGVVKGKLKSPDSVPIYYV